MKLKVPRLRSLPFETQIIERYKRRESSESLVERYLAGVALPMRVATAADTLRVMDAGFTGHDLLSRIARSGRHFLVRASAAVFPDILWPWRASPSPAAG